MSKKNKKKFTIKEIKAYLFGMYGDNNIDIVNAATQINSCDGIEEFTERNRKVKIKAEDVRLFFDVINASAGTVRSRATGITIEKLNKYLNG